MTGLTVTGVMKRRGRSFTLGPVDLVVDAGQCLGLIGSNGCGKTTLMRCLLGTTSLDSGEIRWRGRQVRPNIPTPGVAGMVEEPVFFDRLTARENLVATRPGAPFSTSLIMETLELVGLSDHADTVVGRFSQGMRQRLGLARVLGSRPDLIVLDEPTNGLDPLGIRWLREQIRELCRQGVAVIVSSHMLHEVQATATHFVMLDAGKVFASGPVAVLSGSTTLEDYYFSRGAQAAEPST